MDIIQPSVSPKIINNVVTLAAAANSLIIIPNIQTGYVKRATIQNPAGAPCNLMIQDVYTPDISVNNPTPTLTTKDRYPITVPAGGWLDINGHTISKHMGTLQVTSDTASVVFGYTLELE